VQREKSLLIHATRSFTHFAWSNIEENDFVDWKGQVFRPIEFVANFIEYLRSTKTGAIVGVELHLSSEDYERVLAKTPGFEKVPRYPEMVSRWRFWIAHEEKAEIHWEQVSTQNPYVSAQGDVLLLLPVWHLSAREFAELRAFVKEGRGKGEAAAERGIGRGKGDKSKASG
jgi:hypothetical protein